MEFSLASTSEREAAGTDHVRPSITAAVDQESIRYTHVRLSHSVPVMWYSFPVSDNHMDSSKLLPTHTHMRKSILANCAAVTPSKGQLRDSLWFAISFHMSPIYTHPPQIVNNLALNSGICASTTRPAHPPHKTARMTTFATFDMKNVLATITSGFAKVRKDNT